MNNFHVALPKAFDDNEQLNIKKTIEHAKRLIAQDVNAFLFCGSTGEQHSLDLEEKIELIRSIETTPDFDEVEVIFGVANIRLKHVQQLIEEINHSHAIDYILLGFPPYILPSQEDIKVYVTKASELSEKPIILYNNPKRTGFELHSETFLKLAKLENIAGLKEAGNPTNVSKYKAVVRKDFAYFVGGEVDLQDKISLGYTHLSSILGNKYPKEVKKYFETGVDENDLLKVEISRYQFSKMKKELGLGICRAPLGIS